MPLLEAGNDRTPPSPRSFLSSAGINSLNEMVTRREHVLPTELGKINDDGHFDPFRARLEHFVTDFFLHETIYLERHKGQEQLGRRPRQHFDVREVGRCTYAPTGDTAHIFCCRYAETPEPLGIKIFEALEDFEDPPTPPSLILAIPSRAGLLAPDALSLVHPLELQPREHLGRGEAGAVFACTESRSGYVADLYWSKDAFIDSLDRVQTIGRYLIDHDAVAQATMRRTGRKTFPPPSAIFSKMYEEAARVAQLQDPALLITGVWGVAIFPGENETFNGQIGVVGYEIEPSTDGPAKAIAKTQNGCFAVLNQTLKRDPLGFLTIEPGRFSRLPIGDLAWYEELPELSR
jgi:hypothetical protein